jgi:Cu(I)/Ag(I) efflux system membrane fusion protein
MDDPKPRQITLSTAQRARMRVATVPVERRYPTAEIRLVGKVTYDETRLAYITAWVPGRIDDLLVDYTGVTVRKGDHMVELYSPELLSAQEELLQAIRGMTELSKSNVESLRRSAAGTVDAARDKLRLWGLSSEQIADIERSGKTSEQVTIFSPASGVVIHRNAQEGMYVDTGTRIFTVADLDAVWVQLDAYESDLQWLRYGQTVNFTTEAYPGERFRGVVSFIDPVLNPQTRTVNVRVNVDNKDGRLKPEMFVRAEVFAQLARHGQIFDESLIGKWVSPMHPEIIKDKPGQCDICGMDLVPAESLGYASAGKSHGGAPLVIPATAALLTGTRAVVYVEQPEADRPTYVGREVVLGPRAGDSYVVESGLSEGDLVVVSGNFKIDIALQIQAKPSMMNPDGGGSGGGHDHGSR